MSAPYHIAVEGDEFFQEYDADTWGEVGDVLHDTLCDAFGLHGTWLHEARQKMVADTMAQLEPWHREGEPLSSTSVIVVVTPDPDYDPAEGGPARVTLTVTKA